MSAPCFLCMTPTDNTCEFCGIPICSEAHMILHRSKADNYCYPFRVAERPEVGRYVVATRDILPMELILIDEPGVFGPNHDTRPACLECLLPVATDGSAPLCDKCGLPLCNSDKCRSSEKTWHGRLECKLFQEPTPSGFKFRVKMDRPHMEGKNHFIAPEYGCIAPLRMLLLKQSDPATWNRLQMLMDHDAERKTETDYQKMFQVNVVDFLRKTCGFDFTEDEIFRAIGILRTNCLMVQDETMKLFDVSGRAVYPTFSFLSHSCISNARYSIASAENGHRMVLRAQTEIREGDEITIQYLSFMYGQCRRKRTIPSYWFFECRCERCGSTDDLGSFLSAIWCPKCLENEEGELSRNPLLPIDPYNAVEGNWKCLECNAEISGDIVNKITETCANKLEDTGVDSVNELMELLDEFKNILHPNHYTNMTIKKYVADIYGNREGFKYNQISKDQIDIKIEYAQQFLDVVGKVDPGTTKWRGQLLYDLHTALVWKANQKYARQKTPEAKKEFLAQIREIETMLQMSIKCLEHEEKNTKEGHICMKAKKALAALKDIVLFIDFL